MDQTSNQQDSSTSITQLRELAARQQMQNSGAPAPPSPDPSGQHHAPPAHAPPPAPGPPANAAPPGPGPPAHAHAQPQNQAQPQHQQHHIVHQPAPPVYQYPAQPVYAAPAVHKPYAAPDNPLDVFSSDSASVPCVRAGGSVISNKNLKIGILVAVLSLVIGAVPIDLILGKYLPIGRVPMGGGIIKASVLGGVSALFAGFLCGEKQT